MSLWQWACVVAAHQPKEADDRQLTEEEAAELFEMVRN